MKQLLLFFSCSFFVGLAAVSAGKGKGTPQGNQAIAFEIAKSLAQFMKPAIEAKDAPATCWYLGQIHGYAMAMRQLKDEGADALLVLVQNNPGQCAGKNNLNLATTFTPAEWTRLSELQKKIANLPR